MDDGQMMALSNLPDEDFLALVHSIISFLFFRESLWPRHGYSRCILCDGHIYPLYLSQKEKANLQISVRTQLWVVGGGWQEVSFSVADIPLALPPCPLPTSCLGVVLIRVVAFLLGMNIRVTECQGQKGPTWATSNFRDQEQGLTEEGFLKISQ